MKGWEKINIILIPVWRSKMDNLLLGRTDFKQMSELGKKIPNED